MKIEEYMESKGDVDKDRTPIKQFWNGRTGTFTATNAMIDISMFTFKDNPHTKIIVEKKGKDMTIENAISRLEVHKEFLSKNGFYTKKAIDMAIEALKKQIPKKFNMVDDCIPVCPECGEEVWDMDWCNSCGQHLSDEYVEVENED